MDTIGQYRLVRELGEGSFGKVYEALAPNGARVALKALSIAATPDVIARFEREARVCRVIDNPNVIHVLDSGVHQNVPYLVMNLLSGQSLDDYLEKNGPLAPDVVRAIAVDVCAGLDVAHALNIIHRDLKPSNLFLERAPNGDIRVVVCDFGLAKVYDEDGGLTATGSILGTPLYMAPEQLSDPKRVDERADIWALSMTLYHALAGRPAITSSSFAEFLLQLTSGSIPPLQDLAPWVPTRLARVIHAGLLPLEKRFESVNSLRDEIVRGTNPPKLTSKLFVPLTAEDRGHHEPRAELPRSVRELDESTAKDPFIGRKLGPYQVTKQLGAGGMGAVYEALSPQGVEVAIKVMQPNLVKHDDGVRRFLREVRAVRRIDSPYVTRLLDEGTDASSNSPYLVTELLRGRDLGIHVREKGPVEPHAAVALLVQACQGVEAAHALGIVHRDIKPANLFVHDDGKSLRLKVCDFGIAKQGSTEENMDASTELTHTGGMLGSPMYMSPEQAKNAKHVDQRSDVWSLCISLHEALSGSRPWPGCTTMGELILAICMSDMPALEQVAPWVDPRLSAIVRHGLVKDAGQRFPSVAALRAALEPFAQGVVLPSGPLPHVDPAKAERARAQATPMAAHGISGASGSGSGANGPTSSPWIASGQVPDYTPSGQVTSPHQHRVEPARGGSSKVIVGLVVAAVVLLIGVPAAVFGARQYMQRSTAAGALASGTGSASGSIHADAPPPLSATVSATATASVSSAEPDAVVDAGIVDAGPVTKFVPRVVFAPDAGGGRASGASGTATTTAATPSASSNVGRGGTGTELDFKPGNGK